MQDRHLRAVPERRVSRVPLKSPSVKPQSKCLRKSRCDAPIHGCQTHTPNRRRALFPPPIGHPPFLPLSRPKPSLQTTRVLTPQPPNHSRRPLPGPVDAFDAGCTTWVGACPHTPRANGVLGMGEGRGEVMDIGSQLCQGMDPIVRLQVPGVMGWDGRAFITLNHHHRETCKRSETTPPGWW